jgi:hypothetical protein
MEAMEATAVMEGTATHVVGGAVVAATAPAPTTTARAVPAAALTLGPCGQAERASCRVQQVRPAFEQLCAVSQHYCCSKNLLQYAATILYMADCVIAFSNTVGTDC